MAGARLDLQNYVPALLTFVSNKMSRSSGATYRRLFGIGVTEWRVMSQLALEPGASAQRICHVIGFDKALVSRSVQILLNQGYVTVEPDATDNRRFAITLTTQGLALHDRVIEVALERERQLLNGMSAQDRKTLIRLLQHMHQQINAMNELSDEPEPGAKRKPRKP